MCPVCNGSKIINVGSYIDLSSNPNPPSGCLTLDKSLTSLSLSFLVCEIEMKYLPSGVAVKVNDYCDTPRHLKGAGKWPFGSECEQGSPAFPLTWGFPEG